MSWLTAATLDNSRLAVLGLFIIVTAGLWAYVTFPSREDPEIRIREAVVTVLHPGMALAQMEALVVRPLEEEIRQMAEVDDIISTVRTGKAIIHVHLHPRHFDLQPIWQDLRNRVNDAREELPPGVVGPFVDDDFGDVAVASLALTGSGFSPADLRRTARDIREQLYAVDGVDRIELHGVREERYFLETTNARLAELGLSPRLLVATLEDQNIILPGGRIDTGRRHIVVETAGYFDTQADIGDVPIAVPETGQVIFLRDIVTVRHGYVDPPERLAYFDGQEAVVLAVTMRPGQNVMDFGPRLVERARDIEAGLPVGYRIELATYQPQQVEQAIADVTSSLYQTLAIVLVLVVLFLGFRVGLIVGVMIPLTMLAALLVMRLGDIELQRVSLASLIISLGMLVSNFVAVAEDIQRRLGEGEERRAAAVNAGGSLALPLLTATLTTVFAFTPPLLAVDEAGEYTRSLSLVIAITLIGSWILALTATPMLCVRFMKAPENVQSADEALRRPYFRRARSALETLLRWRWPFVALLVLALAGAVGLMRFVPQQFFPESERAQFMINVDLPAGYTSRETDRIVREIVAWLGDPEINPEVQHTVAYVGFGGPRFFLTIAPMDPAPHLGFMLITLHDVEALDVVVERTRRHLLEAFPEMRGRITRPFLGNVETGLVELRLSGPDAEELWTRGRAIEAALAAMPGVTDIHNNWENRLVKVAVVVDQSRARRAGITSADVAASLDAYFAGETVSIFYGSDVLVPIMLRAEAAERETLARLHTVSIHSAREDRSVPLAQIADLQPIVDFARIDRRNQQRTLTIAAKHRTETARDFEDRLEAELAPLLGDLPRGHAYEWGGETESAEEARREVFGNTVYALVAIVVLLVWQFNSFRRPFIVALTIPLAFIGAAIGLLVSGSWFGFMAMLGLLSLGGVVVNYAILVISRIDELRAEGFEPLEAVIRGTLLRVRPILMMAGTTFLGLLPLIVWRDVLFYDMANVIFYGLALGMLLALAAVPVFYTLLMGIDPPARRQGEEDGRVARAT
jgi:multidrug efflux pump